jgi:hemerythrin-like metal-binding protein
MTIINLNATTSFHTLESLHRLANERTAELSAAVEDRRSADDISHRLVYLKFYVTSCFRMEKELMQQHGYSGCKQHQLQHEKIVLDLNRLLGRLVGQNSLSDRLLADLGQVLAKLQGHVSRQDQEVFALSARPQSRPSVAAQRSFINPSRSLFGEVYCTA